MAQAMRPTVLVAEDDAMIREIVCEVLDGADFDVLSVDSTQSALEMLESDARIVAAFLDLDLGDRGGGYVVARRARATRPDLVVIYTSGGGQEHHERERVADSVFVPKPYMPSTVRAMLEYAVHDIEARLH